LALEELVVAALAVAVFYFLDSSSCRDEVILQVLLEDVLRAAAQKEIQLAVFVNVVSVGRIEARGALANF